MGLSICLSIIEAHGGRLTATANEPRGVEFQFTVPRWSARLRSPPEMCRFVSHESRLEALILWATLLHQRTGTGTKETPRVQKCEIASRRLNLPKIEHPATHQQWRLLI
jgi:hypothetical protein